MTIAFDAFTSNTTAGDVTFPHTPVGTPRGVIYMCQQNTAADQIATVTYGGVAMTEVSGSPLLGVAGDEDQTVYAYFLGASIPTGVQDVVVDTTSTSGKTAVVITVTAAADTQVDATATQDAVEANPQLDINTTASTNTFVIAALASGHDGVAAVTPGASYTQIFEANQASLRVASFIYRTANPTGGTVSIDWTATIEDAHILGIALREAGGAPSTTMDPFGMSGFFGA